MRPETYSFPCKDSRLITRASSDLAGLQDYTVKRDFRRDLDQDIRREGYDYFWPNATDDFEADPGGQPFPFEYVPDDPEQEPITLVHLARRPNGQHATIVGTQSRLWRFFSMDIGPYIEGTGVNAYIEEPPALNTPYFDDNPGEWILIGSGFSEDGHRWEALNINGYVVLNNGVDLPMTYRLEESEVVPIYELREQGIGSVGTIGELEGVLLLGDITEIQEESLDDLFALDGDIESGDLKASQSTTTVTTGSDFFTDGTGGTANHEDRHIVWEDGTSTKITNVVSAREVTVNTSATVTQQRFTLRMKAVQTGAAFSGTTTGSVAAAGTTVTSSGAFFALSDVGKTIRFSNGFSATITGFTGVTQVTIDVGPVNAISALPFWITESADFEVAGEGEFFDASMEGLKMIWDSGEVRTIVSVLTDEIVEVDSDSPIPLGFFRIENPDTFAPYTDLNTVDRIHYRVIWGMPDEPRRFGSTVEGTIDAGSYELNLTWPVQSFSVGDSIAVVGAGIDGGTMQATIASISRLGQRFILDTAASTSVEDAQITQFDVIGSIVGFEDLKEDSSGILRILKLQDLLVIYKDTAIYTAPYTGLVEAPFAFRLHKIPDGHSLFYRWTLVDVGGQFHLYAGVNAFYRFDLMARVPQEVLELKMVDNIFFDQATIANIDRIYAAENGITKEVWFQFPSSGSDTGICFDYSTNSVSTTSISVTAAATIKKPVTGTSPGITEDWFVMGTSLGVILQYGKTDAAQSTWANAKSIFYRREAYPFTETKLGYDSTLQGGLGSFGDDYNEKDLKGYVLYLASQSPNATVILTLNGARNPAESVVTLLNNYSMSLNTTKPYVPVFYRQHYFQDKLVISGQANPCRLRQREFEVQHVYSKSHQRRP